LCHPLLTRFKIKYPRRADSWRAVDAASRILRLLWCAGGLAPPDLVLWISAEEEEDFMSLSRRHFFGSLGLGSVGLLSAPFIIGRGR
jgi:hypothetical protein